MASISTTKDINKGKITVKETRYKPGVEAPDVKFSRVQIDGKRLLLKTTGTSYGFRYEETHKGKPKYTLPLMVSKEFSDNLYKIAEKLGSEDYASIYETDDGPLVYVRVVTSGYRPSYIHDCDRTKIKPSEKTSTFMNARAVIEVESLRVGGESEPKLQLSLYQAELEDSEVEHVDLLDD